MNEKPNNEKPEGYKQSDFIKELGLEIEVEEEGGSEDEINKQIEKELFDNSEMSPELKNSLSKSPFYFQFNSAVKKVEKKMKKLEENKGVLSDNEYQEEYARLSKDLIESQKSIKMLIDLHISRLKNRSEQKNPNDKDLDNIIFLEKNIIVEQIKKRKEEKESLYEDIDRCAECEIHTRCTRHKKDEEALELEIERLEMLRDR